MDRTENGSPTPLLRKLQRNGVIRAIQKGGLDLSGFTLDDSGAMFCIKHKKSGSYFTVSGHAGQYSGNHVVGDNPEWPYTAHMWETVISRAEMWAHDVKLDLATPDLWADHLYETKLLEATSNGITDNAPFSLEEQKEIAVRLQGLADSIGQKFSLTGAQIRDLNEKIVYLIEAAHRVGRKDWLILCAGIILTSAIAIALPPESVRAFAVTALRAIGLLYPELPFEGAP